MTCRVYLLRRRDTNENSGGWQGLINHAARRNEMAENDTSGSKTKFVLKKQNLASLTKADLETLSGGAPDVPVPRNPLTPGTDPLPGNPGAGF
jgi:hypothetical protein